MKHLTYLNLFVPLFFITLLLIIMVSACHDKPVIPVSPAISYSNEVQPIILGSCALSGCHDSYSDERALTNYNEVMHYVSAGDALNSRLYKSITSLGSGQMPIDQPLSEDQLKLIYVWIMQGAKNN